MWLSFFCRDGMVVQMRRCVERRARDCRFAHRRMIDARRPRGHSAPQS